MVLMAIGEHCFNRHAPNSAVQVSCPLILLVALGPPADGKWDYWSAQSGSVGPAGGAKLMRVCSGVFSRFCAAVQFINFYNCPKEAYNACLDLSGLKFYLYVKLSTYDKSGVRRSTDKN